MTVTRKAYLARIPGTGYFVRCPRWIYNRWPWTGIISIWDEELPNTRSNLLRRLADLEKAKARHRKSASCEMPRTCGACHFYSGAVSTIENLLSSK